MIRKPWTKGEEIVLSICKKFGMNFEMIGSILGRKSGAVYQRWRGMKRNERN